MKNASSAAVRRVWITQAVEVACAREDSGPTFGRGARHTRERNLLNWQGPAGPYYLRHTFATEALAAGISTFELAR